MKNKKKNPQTVNNYKNLPGLSRGTAIKFDSFDSEVKYLDKLLGKRGANWIEGYQMLPHTDGRTCDVFDVVLKDGTKYRLWFDVSGR